MTGVASTVRHRGGGRGWRERAARLVASCVAVAVSLTGCVDQPLVEPAARTQGGCNSPSWATAQRELAAQRDGPALAALEQAVRDCPEHVEAHQSFIEVGLRAGGDGEQRVRAYYAGWQAPAGTGLGPFVAAMLETTAARRLDSLGAAIAEDPGLAAAHREIGAVWLRSGKPENALEPYDRALRLDGEDPRSNLGMARVLVELRRGGDAMRHYRAYLASRASDRAVEREMVGVSLYELGDAAAIIDSLTKLHEAAPRDADLLADLAAAEWLLGRRESAADRYRQILQLRPSDSRAAKNLGNLYYEGPDRSEADKRRDWPRARLAYRYYLALEPESGESAFDRIDRIMTVPERLRQIEQLLGPAATTAAPDVSDL